MPKNTLLLTAILAVVASFLIGVSIGRSLGKTPAQNLVEAPTPTQTPTPTQKTYTNTLCGISLSYPSTVQVEESTTSGTLFYDTKHPEQTSIVACQKNIPRIPLTKENMETVLVRSESGATLSATLYHDTSAKDGTPIEKLIFTNPKTGLDIYLAGSGELFTALRTSLRLK